MLIIIPPQKQRQTILIGFLPCTISPPLVGIKIAKQLQQPLLLGAPTAKSPQSISQGDFGWTSLGDGLSLPSLLGDGQGLGTPVVHWVLPDAWSDVLVQCQEDGSCHAATAGEDVLDIAASEGPRLADAPPHLLDSWQRLCPHLRPKHLRMLGLVARNDEVVTVALGADDARWTALPKLRAFDESATLAEVLGDLAAQHEGSLDEAQAHLLAEFEVAFVLFAVTNDWTAFVVWRRWLVVLTAVDDAFLTFLPLYRDLIPLLQEQLTLVPVEVFDTLGQVDNGGGAAGGDDDEDDFDDYDDYDGEEGRHSDGVEFIRAAAAGLFEIVSSVEDDFTSRWPDVRLLADGQRLLREQVVEVASAARTLRRTLEQRFARSFGSDADRLLARAAKDFARPGDDIPTSSDDDDDDDTGNDGNDALIFA